MPLLKTIHKITSPILYKSGLYQRFWANQHRKSPFSFAVFYHRVITDHEHESSSGFDIERGISASDFERQMRFLVRHFTPVKASEIHINPHQKIQFSVTLDDGYEDNYRVAAPILKKLGIPATFYVVSDFVGTDRLFWWEQVAQMMRESECKELDITAIFSDLPTNDRSQKLLSLQSNADQEIAYGQLCALIRNGLNADIPSHLNAIADYLDVTARKEGREFELMNWRQLNDLLSQGFEIGGHTASHINVVGAEKHLLVKEITDSMKVIESHMNEPVKSFAYPYGLFDNNNCMVSDLLAQTNCKTAFTADQGVINSSSNVYELPRTKLNRAYDFACAFNIQDTVLNSQ